ncbi:MAG: hypothetical protein JST80_05470 [Bdellovibrionales bacterium]|nr:hypothetical protein [Bdellovibrionales bacterium]
MSKISSDYSGRDELQEQYRAQQEAKEQIRDQNEQELDRLKQSYAAQKADNADRFERSIQAEKINHYDQLRKTKRELNREQARLETDGRKIISQKTADNTKAELAAAREGESRVNEVKQKYAASEEYERNQMLNAQNEIRTNHRRSAEAILKDSETKIGKLHDDKAKALEQAQTTHAIALQQMEDHYNGLRTGAQEQYESGLKNLYQRTQDEFGQKQLLHSKMIEAYQKRAQDPFYSINRYDSDLLDIGDEYVLRVKVPDYERNQFRVQVAGQEIQLMGIRHNEEKTEIEPGRWISSNSHQTVSERYPLDHPVDGRSMTMSEQGDWLEYHLPKFNKNHRYSDAVQPKTYDPDELALVKEIEFPKSLPRPAFSKKSDSGTMA